MSASTQPTTAPAPTPAPLLRYLRATPVVRDHEGAMFSASSAELTHHVTMSDQSHNSDSGQARADPAELVLDLLFAPHGQRLHTPPAVPIDHPAVVVLVDHGATVGGTRNLVMERGTATVRALQGFLDDWLYLPVSHLPQQMIREPYFDGEEFDTVSYSEIVTAMAGGRDPQHQAEARWEIQHLLQLAVYRVRADQLLTPEAVAHLPYR